MKFFHSASNWLASLYMGGMGLFFLAAAVVHIGFAICVASDIRRHQSEGRFTFGGTFLWFMATLLGGVFVAAVYWLMTYSMFNPRIAAAIGNRPRVSPAPSSPSPDAPR